MAHKYTADVSWTLDGDFAENTYSRGHKWHFDGGIEVLASASPLFVPMPQSQADAVDPEEAFVASISSCHMLWFLDFARRAQLTVQSYNDEAEGIMRSIGKGKMAITDVTLRPLLHFEGKQPSQTMLDNLHHRAHESCFIANSVNSAIHIEPRSAKNHGTAGNSEIYEI